MARVEGKNLPKNKPLFIGLTEITGIGRSTAIEICKVGQLDQSKRVKDLTEDEIKKIRKIIEQGKEEGRYLTEADLKKTVAQNIARLISIKSYRGIRHRKRLPVRGQRTHTNARTRKGKAVAIAGKKK